MSTTSQVTDFSDLYTDLQNRVRVETGKTATENQAKRYINTALQDMHIGYGERFPWAERHAILITQAPYSTGTVTISQGSTALNGSGTAWTTNNNFSINNMRAGGKVVIDGSPEIYEIESVTNDANATLTSAYVSSDAAGASYEYFEDEYDLHADFLRPIDKQYFDQNTNIEIIPRREFRMRYPRNKTTGKPLVCTIHDRAFSGDTTPRRRATFWHPPSEAVMIPYNFVTNKLAVSSAGVAQTSLSADDDEPIIPLPYRHLLVMHALYHWYRDKKNDTRSQEAKAEFVELMQRVIGDEQLGQSRPQIRPRIQNYKSRAQRPYRGKGSRFVVGSAFDEIRNG